MNINLKIKPICLICHVSLSLSPFTINNFTINKMLQFDCRNSKCPLHVIVERCRVIYDPIVDKHFFSYCNFWTSQDNIWYHIEILHNVSIKIGRTQVIPDLSQKPSLKEIQFLISNIKPFLAMDEGNFHISIKDNLIEKIPQLINKAKIYVLFS